MKPVTIGLFGTCGGSKWRDAFIKVYQENDITFYNPQVEDWTPECAVEEAEHLESDDVILFPVTGETYGFGSLAETGFSILQVLKNKRRGVIIMIDDLDPAVAAADPAQAKASKGARALVRTHLAKLKLPKNVVIVSTLDEMLTKSLEMHYDACLLRAV